MYVSARLAVVVECPIKKKGIMWEKGIMLKQISRDAVARWLVSDIVNAEIKSLEKRFDDLRCNVNAIITGGVYRGKERQEGPFGDVDRILTITQAEYDALPEKDERTLYLVKKQEDDAHSST